jgi:hypothetical protein
MELLKIFSIYFRVTLLTDIEKISEDTSCMKAFIKKGIAIASFIYARCLHLGRAVKKNEQMASNYYKLVKFFNNHHIYSLI